MGTGIVVCGLNGSGKSTLGRALADALSFHFIDSEDLYFPKESREYIFASPRSRQEAETLLMEEVRQHGDFVFAAVKGDYGENILPLYRCAVCIDVPKDIRLLRIRSRSFQKFGGRMQPGGDLYEKEEAFFDMAASRTESYVENWLQTLNCPIIRVDGTKPVADNVRLIVEQLRHRISL